MANFGIAAALSDEDEICLHERDTLEAGDGLCDPAAVKVLVEEGALAIEELISWGTQFERTGTNLAFTKEGAHSRSRVLHAQGKATGREIVRVLAGRARTLPQIRVQDRAFSTELCVEDGRVRGLRYVDEADGRVRTVVASAVLLACGGLGCIYRDTTNPAMATGDGMAMAYEAGAELRDLEFIQFHPTALQLKGAPRLLLPELTKALEGLASLSVEKPTGASRPEWELYNAWTLAQIITRSALAREESRGSHYRNDFPYRHDEEFLKHSLALRSKPITFEEIRRASASRAAGT